MLAWSAGVMGEAASTAHFKTVPWSLLPRNSSGTSSCGRRL